MKCVKFEEIKKELNFTISVILGKQNNKDTFKRIIDYQEQIRRDIRDNSVIEIIKLNEFRKAIQDKPEFIYLYPKERLHFSFINLLTFELGDVEFKDAEESITKTKLYEKIKEIMKEIKLKINMPIPAKIKRIYIPKRIENYIECNIFLDDPKLFTEKLKDHYKYTKEKLLQEGIPNKDVKIKAYSNEKEEIAKYKFEYFAVNIFRFLSQKEQILKGWDFLYNKIETINKEIKENPLDFKIHFLDCIISDAYLSNNVYKIDKS